MKRFYFLFVLLLSINLNVYSQWTGCLDPEAWNYQPGSDGTGTCVYIPECEEGSVARILQLFVAGPLYNNSRMVVLSTDLQDTIADKTFLPISSDGGAILEALCLVEDQCYFVDLYFDQPNIWGYINIFINDPDLAMPEYFAWFAPSNAQYGRAYLSSSASSSATCGVLGCTDPTALNYWSFATENYNCIYCETNSYYLRPEFPFAGNLQWSIRDQDDMPVTQGTYWAANPPVDDELVCLEDGCYDLVLSGNGSFNSLQMLDGNDSALVEISLTQDGIVRYPFGVNTAPCPAAGQVYGCTNPLGANYDPTATIDNGSCFLDNENCSLGVEMEINDETNQITFSTEIYATDYPVLIYWDFGDGSPIVENLLWSTHIYAEGGTYEVCATMYVMQFFEASPLCTDMACVTLNSDSLGFTGGFPIFLAGTTDGLTTVAPRPLKVFPNPTADLIQLMIPEAIVGKMEVQVINLTGQTVMSHLINSNETTSTIDVNGLAPGIYMVMAKSGSQFYAGKFVKQ